MDLKVGYGVQVLKRALLQEDELRCVCGAGPQHVAKVSEGWLHPRFGKESILFELVIT